MQEKRDKRRITTEMQCLYFLINDNELIGMPHNVGRFKPSNDQEMTMMSRNDIPYI